MYIWLGDDGGLHSSDNKIDVPPGSFIFVEPEENSPFPFWNYMKENKVWYPDDDLTEFNRYADNYYRMTLPVLEREGIRDEGVIL